MLVHVLLVQLADPSFGSHVFHLEEATQRPTYPMPGKTIVQTKTTSMELMSKSVCVRVCVCEGGGGYPEALVVQVILEPPELLPSGGDSEILWAFGEQAF